MSDAVPMNEVLSVEKVESVANCSSGRKKDESRAVESKAQLSWLVELVELRRLDEVWG